jgi:hypothetical protein
MSFQQHELAKFKAQFEQQNREWQTLVSAIEELDGRVALPADVLQVFDEVLDAGPATPRGALATPPHHYVRA